MPGRHLPAKARKYLVWLHLVLINAVSLSESPPPEKDGQDAEVAAAWGGEGALSWFHVAFLSQRVAPPVCSDGHILRGDNTSTELVIYPRRRSSARCMQPSRGQPPPQPLHCHICAGLVPGHPLLPAVLPHGVRACRLAHQVVAYAMVAFDSYRSDNFQVSVVLHDGVL